MTKTQNKQTPLHQGGGPIHSIGLLSLLWNDVDYWQEVLLRMLLGGTDDVDLILAQLTGNSRGALLKQFAEKKLNEDWCDYANHVFDGINICRINRNLILHGIHRATDGDSITLERFTKNLQNKKRFTITNEIFKELHRDLALYEVALNKIVSHFAVWQTARDGLPPSPKKPPLPRNLEGTLPTAP